jgi:hypothetical protein
MDGAKEKPKYTFVGRGYKLYVPPTEPPISVPELLRLIDTTDYLHPGQRESLAAAINDAQLGDSFLLEI